MCWLFCDTAMAALADITWPYTTQLADRSRPAEAGAEEEKKNADAGTRSQVLIGHLASYEGMGQAEVECVSGCECETTVLDGWWERHASLQVMHTVMVRLRRHGWLPEVDWLISCLLRGLRVSCMGAWLWCAFLLLPYHNSAALPVCRCRNIPSAASS